MTQAKRLEIQQQLAAFSNQWVLYQENYRRGASNPLTRMFDLIRDFERLSAQLYLTRAQLAVNDPLRTRIEEFFATVGNEVLLLQKEKDQDSYYGEFVQRYRMLWRENFNLFVFTASIFLAGLFVGWHVVIQNPQNAAAFNPQSLLEKVIHNEAWFDSVNENPLMIGYQIARNNISVCINIFILGAVCGIGGFIMLLYNALHFGSLLAFCQVHHFQEKLRDFVVGHGPLELTIIVASAFASFLIGRVFYMRPYRLFPKRMGKAASDAACLITGIAPWLVLAAIIEAFVSPRKEIAFSHRLLVAGFSSALFWLWTFWPVKKTKA